VWERQFTEELCACLYQERGGSSRQAILKYIVKHYNVGHDERLVNSRVKVALRAGVKNGTLKQSKGTGASGSFRIGDKETTEKKPKAARAKKPKAKKPKAAGVKKVKKPKKAGEAKVKKPKAKKPKAAKKPAAAKARKPKAAAKKPKAAAKAKKAAKKWTLLWSTDLTCT